MIRPEIKLLPLDNIDGAISYSHSGYLILASANGPVEVQRRDEIPEEAAVEVNIRPATGTGALKERHLESKIHSTLRQIIKVEEYPRTLIQVTLQIVKEPSDTSPKFNSMLLIAPLIQAATAALISAALPLSVAPLTIAIAISKQGSIIMDPSPQLLQKLSSVHIFTLAPDKTLLFSESVGIFDLPEWESVLSTAEYVTSGDEAEIVSMKTEALEQSHEAYANLWKNMAIDIVKEDRRWK